MTKSTMNWKSFLPTHCNIKLFCIIGSCVAIYALRKYQTRQVMKAPTVMDEFETITRHVFEISQLNSNDYKLWLNFQTCTEGTHRYYEKCQDLINQNVLKHSTANDFNAFVKWFFEEDTQFIKNYKAELTKLRDELLAFEGIQRLGLVKFIYSNDNFVTRFNYVYRRYKLINAFHDKNEFSGTSNDLFEFQKYLKEYDSFTEKATLKLRKDPSDTEILNLPTMLNDSETNVPRNEHSENMETISFQHLSNELLEWSNYKARMQEEFQYNDQSICAKAIEFLRICYEIFELIQNFICEAIMEFASKEKRD